jgi:two-component system sensor histidine kinase DesK
MIRKLYPADQIEKYLLIDIAALVFLAYHVFIESNTFGFAGSLAMYALFFGTFYASLWYRDWRLLASSLANCGVLAILAIYYDQSMVAYAFITADLLGRARSRTVIFLGMLGIVIMHVVTYFPWNDGVFSIYRTYQFPVLILQLIVPIIVHTREKSKSLKRELAEANEKIERYIQEGERSRIARDLHDTIGQTLTMIKLKSELAAKLVDKQAELAKKEMREVTETSRFALKQVRELVTSMKFVSLEEELRHAEKLLHTAGIRLTVTETDSLPRSLSSVTETMLALSLREAFTNIIKHSRAAVCTVQMGLSRHEYEIAVVDDGIGMAGQDGGGHGIDSIRERMRLVQGSAVIASSPEGGFAITLRVPVKPSERVDVS